MESPDGWEVPVETGMIVELHSLSRAELNGRRGECTLFDPDKERWAVQLGAERMAVRSSNLKRAPPAPPEVREKGQLATKKANGLLTAIRQGQGPPAELFSKVVALLDAVEEYDPACVSLHQVRGDMAHMQQQFAKQVTHARRAVANGHNLRATDGCNHQNVRRMALAGALGNTGDLEGELLVLRRVLQAEPGHVCRRGSNSTAPGGGAAC